MRSFSKSVPERDRALSVAESMWLDADEPCAFDLINAHGRNSLILIADHASNRVPRCLQQLGLSDEILASHIAWDAGTANVARRLSALLDAPLLLSNYSRLVIDCNRDATNKQAILTSSDGVPIPGNFELSAEHIASRIRTLFTPYHDALESLLEARREQDTAILSVHSFNPRLQGEERPWSIGVCYGHDTRLAHALLPQIRKFAIGPVGDNQPYSIEDGIDYSLPYHAASRGLPHVMLEIRRDKIESTQDANRFAAQIQSAWLAWEASVSPESR